MSNNVEEVVHYRITLTKDMAKILRRMIGSTSAKQRAELIDPNLGPAARAASKEFSVIFNAICDEVEKDE